MTKDNDCCTEGCIKCDARKQALAQPVVKDSLTAQNHLNEQDAFELYMQVTKWSPDADSEAAFRYAYRHGVKYSPTIWNNQTVQKPLSDEGIYAIAKECSITLNKSTVEIDFARAIEKAHKIGE